MKTKRFIGHNGVTLVADTAGHADGSLVLLLHGGGQTRHSWGTAAEALAQRGYHTIALDARGHGDSDWAPDGDYTIGAFAADLTAVIATLPHRPALVGASLGGLTSLVTLGESGTAIASALVLVDITPKVDIKGVAKIQGFMSSHPEGFSRVEEAAAAVAAYLPHRPKPKDISGLRKNLREGADGRLYWHWDPEMVRSGSRQEAQALAIDRIHRAAANIRVPTLLIRGEHSEVVNAESVESFRTLIPHAEYVDVKGARHMVAGDENSAFNDALIEFLQRTVPR